MISSLEKFGFTLVRGDRFLRLLANRDRRDFREASDLVLEEDLDGAGLLVVMRGTEILGLDSMAFSLLSSSLNTGMQNSRELCILFSNISLY